MSPSRSFGFGRWSHVAIAVVLLVLMASSSCCVHADQHKHKPNRRRALTTKTKTGHTGNPKEKTSRRLQWPWPEGRDGHKITNDSRDTLEPTPSPTKQPTPSPPTRSPVAQPTVPAAGTVYLYTDDDDAPNRLPRCHGDCDDDDDCRSGLVCYQRSTDSSKEVYGCEGRAQGGKDYCVDPADMPGEPTASPTAAPTAKPSEKPTPAPTLRMTDPPSPSPTKSPTMSPTTVSPTAGPTAAPVVSEVPPIVNVPVDEIKEDDGAGDDSTKNRRSVNVTTPVPEFALGLTYPEEVVVNSVFTAIITDDLKEVMTGYLNREVGAALSTDDALVFEGVDLTVKPVASSNRRRRRLRRELQDAGANGGNGGNVARFDIGGSANLKIETDAASGEDLDDETKKQIEDKVDSAVRAAVSDEDKMMAYIREHASTNLLKALEGVEDPTFADESRRGGNVASASDGGNSSSNGASIGQIVGFALVGVMAAGLLATGFVLYKRRQYQRRQELEANSMESTDDGRTKERGEFLSETTAGHDSEDPRGSGSGFRLIPFGGSKKQRGVDATHDELDSSSSAEEEYGFDEGTRDDDTFAQELQDAATVDKRAWEELDSLRDRAASMNKNVSPIPPPSSDAPHVELEDDNNGNGLAFAAAAAAGIGAAGVAGAMASSRRSSNNTPESDGPPSGPPSESSGGWPAGNAATVASILAATGMPQDSAANPNYDENDSTALQEFQAVQQFVNSFEDNKVRVDDEVPHSESKEDREFLQMGMQGFYADERNPNAMYYGAAGAAVAGAGVMAARNGADPPADNTHYEDDDTIGSSVMNSVASDVGLNNDSDADKRRIGITPYGEQTQYDSPRANGDVVPATRSEDVQETSHQGYAAAYGQQEQNAQQLQEQGSAGNRLGINTFSEVRREEGMTPTGSSPGMQAPYFPQSKPEEIVGSPR